MNNLIYASISIIKLILYINIFILYYILYIINIIYYIRNSERGCGNDRASIKARDRAIDSYTPLLRGGYKGLDDIYDRYDSYDKYRYIRVLNNNDTPRGIDGTRSPRRSYKHNNEGVGNKDKSEIRIENNNRNKDKRINKSKGKGKNRRKSRRKGRRKGKVN